MEHHPLLRELLNVCAARDVDPAKAHTTFQVHQELCLVRKLSDLNYCYNEELGTFYLSGKTSQTDETTNIYIPVMYNDEITVQQMISLQEILSPSRNQIYLFIRDGDSSSTCYCITKGLIKPDSPETCKRKKELEDKKHYFEKSIRANRKLFYTKASRQKKEEENSSAKSHRRL